MDTEGGYASGSGYLVIDKSLPCCVLRISVRSSQAWNMAGLDLRLEGSNAEETWLGTTVI